MQTRRLPSSLEVDVIEPPSYWREFIIVGLIFLGLSAVRWEIVDSPPYYDFAVGVWTEAEYLCRTNWDYQSLRDATHINDEHSGPRSYLLTIIPGILAILLKLCDSHQIPIVVYHLSVFLFTAIIARQTYQLVRRQAGGWGALLVSAAVLTTPVFCTQVDMTGMEMFLCVAVLASLGSLRNGRYLLAAIYAFIAFAVKPTGLVVALSAIGALTILALASLLARRITLARSAGIGIIMFAMLALVERQITLWGSSFDAQVGGGIPLTAAWLWSPDVSLISIATVSLLLFRVIPATYQSIRTRRWADWVAQPALLTESLFILIFISGLLAAVLTTVPFLPRYMTLAVPFMYILFTRQIYSARDSRILPNLILSLLVVWNLLNWNGRYYPDLIMASSRYTGLPMRMLSRSGSFIERSHEYLPDHQSNIEAARIIEQAWRGEPVVTSKPFVMFLSYPEMGYVTKPIPSYCVNGIRELIHSCQEPEDLLRDRPKELLVVQNINYYSLFASRFEIPWPTGRDVTLFQDELPLPLIVYRRHWTEAGDDPWYEAGQQPDRQVASLIRYFLVLEGIENTIEYMQYELREGNYAGIPQFRIILAGLLAHQKREEQAREQLRALRTMPEFSRPSISSDTDARPLSVRTFHLEMEQRLSKLEHQPDQLLKAMAIAVDYGELDRATELAIRMIQVFAPTLEPYLPKLGDGPR